MHVVFERRFAALLVIVTAVGCATATVGEDPVVLDPDAATGGNAATGGATSSSGGTDSSSAGTTAASGATTNSGGTGARANFGGAGRVAGGGQTSSAGRASASGGSTPGSGGMSSGIAGCENPRDPAQPGAAQGSSGSFDTAEAVCFFVVGTFNAWNCSNIGGRTVTINGSLATCGGSLPAPVDGGYYFEFSASTDGTNYTSFYWYTS
jgi:hypothetical protein